MEEKDFKEKCAAFEAAINENPGNTDSLRAFSGLLMDRAAEFKEEAGEGTPPGDEEVRLLREADEYLQTLLEVDETDIEAYESLSMINFRIAEAAATPAELERLYLDAAIFELGAGACYIFKDDLVKAREHFDKSFGIMKDKQKIAVIPFTFMLSIDYLAEARPEEQTVRAARQMLPTGVLTGHEEVDILCNALTYGKLIESVKPTMTARASFRLAERVAKKRGNQNL